VTFRSHGSRTRASAVALLTILPFLVATACRTAPPGPPLPDLGDLFLIGFHGTTLADAPDADRLLCQARVGGIILFETTNVVDPAQLAGLTSDLQRRARECAGRPLLIAVDAEGGAVMRLSPRAGYAPTLSHRELGEANDLTLTELEARRIGGMLRAAGINWNLAPVVDVGYNPANPVIVGAGRSFSANPRLVTAHARAYLAGMRAAGVLTALKHFPGHGSSDTDSHDGFVDVTETANPDVELVPYRVLLSEGIVDAVVTAHVFNRHLDATHPATLSRATLHGVLREQLQFRGVIVSDDMRMAAIAKHYGFADAVVLALDAGVDLLLITADRLDDGRSAVAVARAAIEGAVHRGRLSRETVAAALTRVRALRARVGS
jgi:beta-N-acetylhexosaminidase